MDANARTWKAKARELRDELGILFWLNREGVGHYNEQQKRACGAEAEVARLWEICEKLIQANSIHEHKIDEDTLLDALDMVDAAKQWRFNDLITAIDREQEEGREGD